MIPNDSEAAVFMRPATNEIRSAWYMLFTDPLLSLANLKAVAVAGLGAPDEYGGVLLRSVYWRFYFGLLPPPTSLDLFPPALAASRTAYDDIRTRYLVAPDGRWAADCTGGEGCASPSAPAQDGTGWDPLSLDGDSPWKAWFAHVELRETIRQDVNRTFPDIPYFTLERVRRSLVTMLFIFAVLNPDVGYRQGMHELLAVCLMVVDRDSLDVNDPATNRDAALPLSLPRGAIPKGIQEAMDATLDRDFTEHDAFGLFQALMRPMKSLFEWRTEEDPRLRLLGAPQAPILARCNYLQGQLLRKIDPQLWDRLETEGVEAQIWAIRWFRLLLTRELPFPIALRLWDGVFAEDPNLGILDYVCIAMLLLIRNELIEADHSSILTHLLHYPSPSDSYPFNPSLILSQANFLQHDTTPTAGVGVIMQNQDLLGVKVTDRNRINIDIDSPTPWRPGGTPTGTPPLRPNSARERARAGVSGLAAGLFERAQKAGLDRAIMSTVNDLRNNLPETAYSFLPTFSPTPQRETLSPSPSPSNPFTPAGLPNRPPPLRASSSNMSITSMLDAERQMAEMRLALVTMGKAMTQWMDTIKEQTGSGEEQSDKMAEAWAGLDRVRDSLLDAAGKDADEMAKDWAWNDDLDSSRSRASSAAPTPREETSEPVLTPSTPTGTGILDLPEEESSSSVAHETPKQATGRGRVDPPSAIVVVSPSMPIPSGPATTRPHETNTLASKSISPKAAPSVIAAEPSQGRSTSTMNVHSPQPSLSGLPSATSLAHMVSPRTGNQDASSGPPGTYKRLSRINNTDLLGGKSTNKTYSSTPTSVASTTPAPISPPSRTASIRATPAARTPSATGPAGGSADPLGGLDVGFIPSTRHGHERKGSAWRMSMSTSPSTSTPMTAAGTPASGSVSGSVSVSVSGSEPVGQDPLGVNG